MLEAKRASGTPVRCPRRSVRPCRRDAANASPAIEDANKGARSRGLRRSISSSTARGRRRRRQGLWTKNASVAGGTGESSDAIAVIAELCSEIAKLEEQEAIQLKDPRGDRIRRQTGEQDGKTPPNIGDLEDRTVLAIRATLELAQEERAKSLQRFIEARMRLRWLTGVKNKRKRWTVECRARKQRIQRVAKHRHAALQRSGPPSVFAGPAPMAHSGCISTTKPSRPRATRCAKRLTPYWRFRIKRATMNTKIESVTAWLKPGFPGTLLICTLNA